ncbi:PAS domain-containing sensor histidine kinase [Isachenkonia alkalipeptolytica]|uniref:Circadian input-output histidine kinase CikA n=1 Tax=Isachenkonia alkalipeptolytica TaxID=2565777 RepID=A0AA43XLY4_9CLOT|nr:PAS domain S-box protein [Isachenkonia alkalipeptolytica]NBG88674.1 PAS domain S-box protein [Isachenkonia alkalipeptolytica]
MAELEKIIGILEKYMDQEKQAAESEVNKDPFTSLTEEQALALLKDRTLRRFVERERNYRLLVKEMNAGLSLQRLIYNEEGAAVDFEIISVNPYFEKITGIQEENFVGKKASEAIGKNHQDWMAFFRDIVLEEKTVNQRYYSESLDRHLQLKSYFPDTGYVALLMEDITKRVVARREIEETNRQLQGILASMLEPLVIMDPQGKIYQWNKAAEKEFGYSKEEALGRDLHQLLAPKNYHAQFSKHHETFVKDGTGKVIGRTAEFEAKRKNGEVFPMELSLSAIKMEKGWYSIGVIRDITKQKRERKELIKAKKIAEEANRDKSRFMAKISHEMKNPLNGIIGFLELLKDTEISGEQQEYLDTILYSSKNLQNIINDLFDYEKITMGQMHLEEESFVLSDLLRRLENTKKRKAEVKGIELEVILQEGLPEEVCLDSTRIHQVLENLVSNGIKFTEKGRVELWAGSDQDEDGKERLRFQVRDTGIGIAPEGLTQLFTPFYQGDNQQIHNERGTGLGMPIVKDLVDLMGGEIKVSSQLHLGTTVAVTIPLKGCSQKVRGCS